MTLEALTRQAQALQAAQRLDEAVEVFRRAALAYPRSAVAEHNLAAALGDAHRREESEAAARRAFARGLDAPETWLVLARALQGQGRLDEAAAAFDEAVARRPGYADALAELAQLIWMRTGDLAVAAAPLDAAIRDRPVDAALRLKRAALLESAAEPRAAYEGLRDLPESVRNDPWVRLRLAQLAPECDPPAALAHAQQAAEQLGDQPLALMTLCQAHLSLGEAQIAARIAQALRERWPLNQHAIALLATAWRLAGDPRYRTLYDYDALVGEYRVDIPEGLASSLDALHFYRAHPIGQSLRGGSQTGQSLLRSRDPAVLAFIAALDGPIRRHIAQMGAGYAIDGIWSVRLGPGGFHVNHVHQQGWLSSACYVSVPPAIERGREGWLKFGEPGVRTQPALEPEHFVKPEPGKLVLFPSYMWHGTVPFGGASPRLSIAFDLAPVRD